MTPIRFICGRIEYEAEVDIDAERTLGLSWWTYACDQWFGAKVYGVCIGYLTRSHVMLVDELGRIIVRTAHEIFPVTTECREHGALEHALAAIQRHAIQKDLFGGQAA